MHPLGLFEPQQAIIYEYAGKLVADGLVQQPGGYRRVHPSGEGADHLAVAYLLANILDGIVDHVARGPIGLAAAGLEQEVVQNILAQGCVVHLWVELDAVHIAAVTDGGHR